MKTASATIKRFEIMCMFKREQFNIWMYGTRTEVSFIKEQFGLYSWDLSKIQDLIHCIFWAMEPSVILLALKL